MSTRKQVWQYHCDFCTKRNLSASSIAKHEKHCTLNPNRVCRMCKCDGIEAEQKPINELIACVGLDKANYGIPELEKLTKKCPACMLAAIRQSKIREQYKSKFADGQAYFEAGGPLDLKWDFKEALKSFWADVNEANYEASNGYY